ncbi:hypothetical protein Pyn_09707 [Prunus yedoensis var. nudiflora]|uniref:Uncharacterized protein n=1 Tax=Prunus yedoensis var. nudiflora TaxID=2094558 RepID=A0A314UEK5_PRUYE|nr:hypothetical protein Pyn_09707 [Prunus yedoensis var. nudiflora]
MVEKVSVAPRVVHPAMTIQTTTPFQRPAIHSKGIATELITPARVKSAATGVFCFFLLLNI